MSGIYIHIPYCKQACHYCDFHFSTNLKTKTNLIAAILKEIDLQRDYLNGETLETIYFGGGTPSLLSAEELTSILERVQQNFPIGEHPEISLEANPDDLTKAKLSELKEAGINRLSIGIQSFNNDILTFFNRAHNADMAIMCVEDAKGLGFHNISVDLIFGVPDQSIQDLSEDLERVLELDVPHISIYGLTIEEKTVFGKWLKQNKLKPLNEELAAQHLELIMERLAQVGYEQYEISNFSRPGFESRHNSSYWQGKKYLGIGPAAHSYNGESRQFNVAHNSRYIQALEKNEMQCSVEKLSREDHINEVILTQIRLKEGIDLQDLLRRHSFNLLSEKADALRQFETSEMVETKGNYLRLTSKGKLLADFITEKLII